MKILVTGAKGFIGKNLIANLKNKKYEEIFEHDVDTDYRELERNLLECDFVFHLAGINRPKDVNEFMSGNYDFTNDILEKLEKNNNKSPIVFASSIQAELDNPYGKSKKAGENVLKNYSLKTGAPIFIYRFPNVFGKWCRPNYNSVVATFCNNIANDLPIQINNRDTNLNLIYIDDLVEELINTLVSNATVGEDGYYDVCPQYNVTLGELADFIYSFKKSRTDLSIPNMADAFTKKLYATYLSYLPIDKLSYEIKMNVDDRGSFTEIIRTAERGQFSVNVAKPGITKGNHWHNTKNEKFLVVFGRAKISFRKVGETEVFDYFVSGEKMEVVDIPTGYTHNITNIGESDLVTFMWCNECFDPNRPDTYFLPVEVE
ncbi:MAG: capsular polysaccharide biosynthesis protein CapF [Synergistaceae bacterium]